MLFAFCQDLYSNLAFTYNLLIGVLLGLEATFGNFQFNSRHIGHVAARAHLGPCQRPKGRNNHLFEHDLPATSLQRFKLMTSFARNLQESSQQ